MDARAYTIPRYRLALVREGPVTKKSPPHMHDSADVYRWLSGYFSDLDREHFVAVALDTTHAVIGLHTVSIGSLAGSSA
jgi:DNA repair protein RadC